MPIAPLAQDSMGVRRFGRVNWLGLQTLARRETMRFLAVWQQTLAAPLITAGLFLGVFALALGQGRADVMGVSFVVFLAPGILMMTVIQNAFANTSSSLVSAKVMGNIVDTLMPPLSPLELVLGFLAGAVVRGGLVAGVIWLAVGLTTNSPSMVAVNRPGCTCAMFFDLSGWGNVMDSSTLHLWRVQVSV